MKMRSIDSIIIFKPCFNRFNVFVTFKAIQKPTATLFKTFQNGDESFELKAIAKV